MEDQATQYSSPVRKLAVFFEKSRDQWKAKAVGLRYSLKLANNQIRAVEKSRQQWRQKAEDASEEVRVIAAELEALRGAQKK